MLTILLVATSIVATLYSLYLLVDRVLLADEQPELLPEDEHASDIEHLTRKRALLMKELKDIEFDRETSKIDDEDYERQTKRYKTEWLKIDKRLEEVAGLSERYLEEVDAELEARLDASSIGDTRVPRGDRVICWECAAANATRVERCGDCGAELKPAASMPARAAASA